MAKLKNNLGFSLVEVLVVASTVSVLMAITMPAMTKAKLQARAIVCRSNLRQLVLANIGYAGDNDGFCVPAADDYWNSDGLGWGLGGYHRWHGTRDSNDTPFDPSKGPLAGYFGDGKVKECPQRVEFTKDLLMTINFESGCGGYGYNMAYIGSRLSFPGFSKNNRYAQTARISEIKNPDMTLMFADTVFYQNNQYLIEYSFAEQPYTVTGGRVWVGVYTTPSIHFRHNGLANVGWMDGHIEPKKMAKPILSDTYTAEMANMNIGWFEPVDNSLFDLK
jgi:prepilin-type processing-associated H-X9-DG protein